MGSEDISGLLEAYSEIYVGEDGLEEGLRRRIGAAALGAGLAAGSLGAGGAARAGQWSGQVQARYGSTPAVATQSSVSGAVDRALANPGVSQSASEIKGKTGVTGSGNISYSGVAGSSNRQQPTTRTQVSSSKAPVKQVVGKPTPGKPMPGKPGIKKDIKFDDKKDIKFDDKKDIKFDGKPVPGKPVPGKTTIKPPANSSGVVPGRGPAGQQLTPLINAIRNATGESGREAEVEKALGPRTVNGRVQTGAQRLRGVIDAIRNAQNINRNKLKSESLEMKDLVEAYLNVYHQEEVEIDEATAMAKRGYDEAPIRQKIAKSTGGGKAADRATDLEKKSTFGDAKKAKQRQDYARKQRGDFRKTTSSSPGLHGYAHKSDDAGVKAKQAARGAQRGALTPAEKKQLNREEFDLFDLVLEFLQAEGYAETLEEAKWMMANELDAILEEIEQLDEVSLKTKMSAFKKRATHDFESDGDSDNYTKSGENKTDKIKANIVKKHGEKAGQHAERAAHTGIFGRKSFSMPKKP